MNKAEFTPENKDFIIKNYPSKGGQYCVDKLGGNFTLRSVFNFCLRNGIKKNREYEGVNFDIEIFKNPSTPEMCYFLGYCWADGCVDPNLRSLVLTIQKEDGMEIYEKIKHLGHFSARFGKVKIGRKPTMTIAVHNSKVCRYLETVGFREKSRESPVDLLKTIPVKLHRYFWLGFFDGDGCMYAKENITGGKRFSGGSGICCLSFSGPYDLNWSSLMEFLEDMKCKYSLRKSIRKAGGQVSELCVTSKFDIVNLFELLYKDYEKTGLGLKRKREKYLVVKRMAQTWKVKPESGYAGVYLMFGSSGNKLGYKFILQLGNKRVPPGKASETPEEAAIKRDQHLIDYYGHRTFTNFPITDYIELGKSISGKYD